jgi:putative DNA primase/helicase
MYPDGEYEHPAAVVCVHTSTGSRGPLSPNAPGYLHILDAERNGVRTKQSGLAHSDLPVLIVEGASDVAAAFDLGFVAVGRPSAEGGKDLLIKLTATRRVVVVGENDSGAGKSGMESTFAALRKDCQLVTKIMPPEGIKDLRAWKNDGALTQARLLDYIEKTGESKLDPAIFEDDIAYTIAEDWLKKTKTEKGKLNLRLFRRGFVEFNGRCYEEVPDEIVHGQLYKFLVGKKHINKDGVISQYKPSRAKIFDILDACSAFCPVDADPPTWLCSDENKPNPARLITFLNGVLDVDKYVKGEICLYKPTPDLFTFTVLPYNFNEHVNSSMWIDFLKDIFNGDQEKITLLQQWFGYNCVPDMSYEKLMLLTGCPRSGKSTTLETLQAMLGDSNCCETSFQALAGAFGYQPLIGKLSAIIGDAKSPRSGEAESVLEKVLHITGGDAVSINRKNLTALPLIRLFCRFTIAMNDLPAFTDHSRALEYRTNILTFTNSYVGHEDRGLKARLRNEAATGGIINWALEGLRSLYQTNNFSLPGTSKKELQTFRELVSPVQTFVESCLDRGPELSESTDLLYEIWRWWCRREGRNEGLKATFMRSLLASIPGLKLVRSRKGQRQDKIALHICASAWARTEMLRG